MTTQFFSKIYKLTVDAREAGVGEVLLQERKDNIDLRIAIFVKRFTKIKKKYPQLKKK